MFPRTCSNTARRSARPCRAEDGLREATRMPSPAWQSRLPALLHEPSRAGGLAPCRSGGSREWGGAAGDGVAGDRRGYRACRRSYMNGRGLVARRHVGAAAAANGAARRVTWVRVIAVAIAPAGAPTETTGAPGPCRSGGSRERGGAAGDVGAGDRRGYRACRRSYREPSRAGGTAPCRSGGSREWGCVEGDGVAGDRRGYRACRRSYRNHRGPGPM